MHELWIPGSNLLFFECLGLRLINRYQLKLLLSLLVFDRISFRTGVHKARISPTTMQEWVAT